MTTAAHPALNVMLQGEYYTKLPQSLRDLTNERNQEYRLTSWLGAVNLHMMSTTNVQQAILEIMHQDGPFDLLASSFNLSSCCTNNTAIYGELKLLVVCLASYTVHETMFMVLVPGILIKPHNVLDHIWQC
jgi:hypothetical protein